MSVFYTRTHTLTLSLCVCLSHSVSVSLSLSLSLSLSGSGQGSCGGDLNLEDARGGRGAGSLRRQAIALCLSDAGEGRGLLTDLTFFIHTVSETISGTITYKFCSKVFRYCFRFCT
jgi:hypothetical protein